MSSDDGKQIASLYAKIGFVIESQDFQRVREGLNQLHNQMQEIIEQTAEFAQQLSDISLSAGISPKALQGLRLFGMEAGVAESAIDSLAEKSREFARRAFFGQGNEYGRWGLYFDRFETSSSALEKIIKNINRFAPDSNEVRQLIDELGADYQTLIRLSEQFQKGGGFNSSWNYLEIDDKNIEKMREVRIIQESTANSWDLWEKKFFAKQAENIYWYESKVRDFVQWWQKAILNLYETSWMDKIFGKIVRYLPAVVTTFNHIETVYDTLAKTFTLIKKTGAIGLSVGVATIGTTLITKLMKSMGYMNFDLATTMQRGLNNFLDSTGTFGVRAREVIAQGVGILEDTLRDLLPEALTNTETFNQFFKTANAPNGGIILAFSEIADKIIDKILSWLGELWRTVSQFFTALFNKLMYEMAVFLMEMWARITKKSMWLGDVTDEELKQDKKELAKRWGQKYEDDDVDPEAQKVVDKDTGIVYKDLVDYFRNRDKNKKNTLVQSAETPTTSVETNAPRNTRVSKPVFNYYNNGKESDDAHEDFFSRAKQSFPELIFNTSKYISDTELAFAYQDQGGGF